MANGGRNQKRIARRGLMLVLSSPSGAGKTTLSRILLKADRHVELANLLDGRDRWRERGRDCVADGRRVGDRAVLDQVT